VRLGKSSSLTRLLLEETGAPIQGKDFKLRRSTLLRERGSSQMLRAVPSRYTAAAHQVND